MGSLHQLRTVVALHLSAAGGERPLLYRNSSLVAERKRVIRSRLHQLWSLRRQHSTYDVGLRAEVSSVGSSSGSDPAALWRRAAVTTPATRMWCGSVGRSGWQVPQSWPRRKLLWLRREGRRGLSAAAEGHLREAATQVKLDVEELRDNKTLPNLNAALERSEVVIFVHGADGANLMLMRPCTVVVQLCPCGYERCQDHYFSSVVVMGGGVYYGVDLGADDDPAVQRHCRTAAASWVNGEVVASRALMHSVLRRARYLAEAIAPAPLPPQRAAEAPRGVGLVKGAAGGSVRGWLRGLAGGVAGGVAKGSAKDSALASCGVRMRLGDRPESKSLPRVTDTTIRHCRDPNLRNPIGEGPALQL